jgi:aromatic ring-cleaving dioxygenase
LADAPTQAYPPLDPSHIEGYHAHVYYDAKTKPVAKRLREAIAARFKVYLGSWHDEAVGPHPTSMYQVAFPVADFAAIVPFLMLNREGLSVLVHPVTGEDYRDHASFPLWLGEPLPLLLETLR